MWRTLDMLWLLNRPTLHCDSTNSSLPETSRTPNWSSRSGSHSSFLTPFCSTIAFWPQTSQFSSWKSPPRSQNSARLRNDSTIPSYFLTNRGPSWKHQPGNRSSPCSCCCSTNFSCRQTSQSPNYFRRRCSRMVCLGSHGRTQSSRNPS